MFSRNRLLAIALAATLFGVLMLPMFGQAGTVVAERPVADRPVAATPGLYQVRCWQHGRLLFEERDIELSGDVVSGLKLRGTDRYRQPLMVSDTGNATCLIRSNPPAARK
jgi:hypothetical protein